MGVEVATGLPAGSLPAGAQPAGPLSTGQVQGWKAALLELDRTATDAQRIDQLRALEELVCAAQAAQAVLAVDLDASQREQQKAAGVPAAQRGRGVAAQVGLARRESPHRAQQHLGLATMLVTEMPHTLAAFRAGRITQWRAVILVRETACLTLPDRQTVDRLLAGDPQRLAGLGDGELIGQLRALAYQLDPDSFLARQARAQADRRVSLRPAPDLMTHLGALLPMAQGVAVLAALHKHADSLRSDGDPRGRGQLMADTLVERLTGQTHADQVPITVNLVMTDQALLSNPTTSDQAGDPAGGVGGRGAQVASVPGYGPVPAQYARQLLRRSLTAPVRTWLRRLYTHPDNGQLVALDSRARLVPTGLARLIDLRDQRCRTPWCNAPIREHDHIDAVRTGGPTTAANIQGLCKACNLAKQAPGWHARPTPSVSHTVITQTPTGHKYQSTAPPVLPPRVPPTAETDPDRSSPARPGEDT